MAEEVSAGRKTERPTLFVNTDEKPKQHYEPSPTILKRIEQQERFNRKTYGQIN